MRECSKCGREYEMGMYSLISDMCDDCYEKVKYYTPDLIYTKEYIKRKFKISDDQYSQIDLLIYFHDCEKKVHDEIRKTCIEKKKNMATIFREFDSIEKMKEIIKTSEFELEYSFFFADNVLDTVPCFEDRNKYRSVIFR